MYDTTKVFDDYLESAGGVTDLAADEDEFVLIKNSSYEWIRVKDSGNQYKVEAGDIIYIPKDHRRSIWQDLGRVSAIAGIIGSIATVVLLLAQFGK